MSDMRPVVSQRYLILQNLDHPLQHASFAAGWDAVVFHHEIGECVLQASPLSKRPLNEVFHRARVGLGGHRAESSPVFCRGASGLSLTNVKKGFLAEGQRLAVPQ